VKTHFVIIVAVLGFGGAFAAEAPSLQFGGERIGVPPLSLSKSLAQRPLTSGTPKFGPNLPQFSTEPAPLARELVPRTTPDLKSLESSRREPRNRVSRRSGMPIIEPSDAVDYKMTIVPPDPSIDFKLVIKDPGPVVEKPAAR
jgi:hypothetical protein